jgi:hypothetical protein
MGYRFVIAPYPEGVPVMPLAPVKWRIAVIRASSRSMHRVTGFMLIGTRFSEACQARARHAPVGVH